MSEESVEQEKVGLQPAIVLMTSDEMKKKESGYYDSVCDVRICIGKWINNSTVCIASNLLTNSFVLSLRDANSEPVCSSFTNRPTTRGGVDVVDRLLSSTVQPDIET